MKTTTSQIFQAQKSIPVRVSNNMAYKSDLISSLSDANVSLAFLNWLSNCCAGFSDRIVGSDELVIIAKECSVP